VESSCKLGNETSGSINCWELLNGCATCGLSSGTQLHRVSQLVSWLGINLLGCNEVQSVEFEPIFPRYMSPPKYGAEYPESRGTGVKAGAK
jgi:hypothetical protein